MITRGWHSRQCLFKGSVKYHFKSKNVVDTGTNCCDDHPVNYTSVQSKNLLSGVTKNVVNNDGFFPNINTITEYVGLLKFCRIVLGYLLFS